MNGKPNTHRTSDVACCRMLTLPRMRHPNGSLTVAENGALGMPFDVRRIFYLYDVPAGADRGGHSHYAAQELMVALSGSMKVTLDDGHRRRTFVLDRPDTALYIPAGLWRTLHDFSGGSVCMVLTSERFSEADYVRDYDRFLELTREKTPPTDEQPTD